NGVPVSLDASWSRPSSWPVWGGVTIDVIGETGVLFANAFNDTYELALDQEPGYTWNPVEVSGDPEMIAGFIDAVRDDTEPPVTGEDGLRALQVALSAYASARAHEPVPIETA